MASPAFTEQDVSKAIAGAARHNLTPTRIDIDRKSGTISMFFSDIAAPVAEMDEIELWKAEHDDSPRSRRPQGHRKG